MTPGGRPHSGRANSRVGRRWRRPGAPGRKRAEHGPGPRERDAVRSADAGRSRAHGHHQRRPGGQGSGAGVALTVAVTLAVAETGTPAVGGVPEAVAVLLSKPLSMLPWVMVRVPVTVSAAPGASVVGCAGVDTVMVSPVSLMKTLVRVTLPLLVATRV